MIVNLNDRVTVQLNEWGKKILNDHLAYSGPPRRELPDEYSCQVWSLMRDFGPLIQAGFTIPFRSTDLVIRK